MVQIYKKYGVTTGGYRGERAILKERVIEGLTNPNFTDQALQLTADSEQTIVLTNSNMANGYYIILPDATTLWPNWRVSIINESNFSCNIYYYTSGSTQLNLFKELGGANMTTCILLNDTTSEGEWTTLRTVENDTNADLLSKYTTNIFEPIEFTWNLLQQDTESDESDGGLLKFSLGPVLAGTSIRSIYLKTAEQFTFDADSDVDTSLSVSVGTATNPTQFISSYDLTQSVANNNFTKDYFEEILSTDVNQDIYAYFIGTNLSLLNAGRLKIVVEKAKLIDPTILKNPIVQTQLPIGTIMNYLFVDADGKVPEGYWRLDGTVFPNAATAIPQFVQKLTETNNRLPGPEKLLVGSDQWHQIDNTYGSCGKFCWEGSGLRFPKINNFIQGLSDITQLGKLMEATDVNSPHFHVTGNFNWGSNNGWFSTRGYGTTANMPSGGGVTGWNGSGNGGYHSVASTVTGNQITSYQIQSGTSTKVQPESIRYPYIISIYNKIQNSAEIDLDAIIEASVNKANISLNNLNALGTKVITDSCIPDYESVVTGSASANTFIPTAKNSLVEVNGTDPYMIDVRAWVSPDNGTTKYQVGYFYSDLNNNTRGTSFTFLVPAGWSFTTNFEQGFSYYIYPLKGAS